MTPFHHTEKCLSQIPALMQLINLGFQQPSKAEIVSAVAGVMSGASKTTLIHRTKMFNTTCNLVGHNLISMLKT